eukprot:PhM_4_TR7814/c0_g1_i2/m.14790
MSSAPFDSVDSPPQEHIISTTTTTTSVGQRRGRSLTTMGNPPPFLVGRSITSILTAATTPPVGSSVGDRMSDKSNSAALHPAAEDDDAAQSASVGADDAFALQWVIVQALFIVIGILASMYGFYCLVEQYMRGLIWAIIISVVFHSTHVKSSAESVTRAVEAERASFKKRWSWWLQPVGTLSSARHVVVHVCHVTSLVFGVSSTAQKVLRKVFRMKGSRLAAAVELVDVVCVGSFLAHLCLTLGVIGTGLLIAYFSSAIVFLFVMKDIVKYTRRARSIFTCMVLLLTGLWVGSQLALEAVHVVDTVRDQASHFNRVLEPHLQTIMPHIRTRVEQLASEYHLAKHADVVRDTMQSLLQSDAYDTVDWSTMLSRWQTAYKNFTSGSDDDQWAAVSGYVQRYVVAGGMGVFDVAVRLVVLLVEFFVSSLNVLYEVVLFFLVWAFLHNQPKTVLYYALERWLLVSGESGTAATALEVKVRRRFTGLVTSLLHVASYHFVLTYGVVSITEFPFRMCTSVAAALIALFPFFPKYFLATAPALIYAYVCGAYTPFFVALSVLVTLWMVGDDFLLEVPDMQPFLTGVSMVLGVATFGLKGVVLGPAVIMTAQLIWEGSDVTDAATTAAAAGSTTTSATTAATKGRKANQKLKRM